LRIDTHDARVCEEVWELYAHALARTGPVSTLIEWDDEIPELSVVLGETDKARAVREQALALRGQAGRKAGYAPSREASHPAAASAAEGASPGWRQGGPRESAGSELT
jgi:hypothetical protein